jgi:PAS domain S-box-containing protein
MDISERKVAEEAIGRSEAYLAEAQKLSHTGSFGWKVSSGEIFWSDETFRIFECDLKTKPTLEFVLSRVHPDDREPVQQQIDRARRDGESFSFEHRLQLPSGSIKHVRVTAHPSRDCAGNLEFVGAVTDITERKLAEESLRRSEERFRLVLDSIGAHVIATTLEGELEFVNQPSLDYFGKTLEELKRWHTSGDVLHPDDLASAIAVWRDSIEKGVSYDVDHRFRRSDGVYRWFHVRGRPQRDAQGSIVRWYALLTDIDERKLAEEGLRQSEERLRLVLDNIGAHVMATTSEGELEFVNQPSLDYFGKTLEELKRWLTSNVIVHPDERASAIAVWRRSVEKGLSYDVDNRFRRSDGVYRWFHVRGRPQRDAQGSIVRWYALLTDIDERKKAEEKLEAQEVELRQILDFAPQLIAVYGPNRERLYANRAWLDYTGLSLEDWRQTEATGAFLHPDDRKQELAYFARARSDGSADQMEVRLRKGDGSYRWFLARYNPVRGDNGQILRCYVSCTDIEDRKRAEEKLRQENVALREEIDETSMFEEIVGTSPALQSVLSRISAVAPSDSTVLITGETGTGKELVARAIHRRSSRSSRAFVSVNCAAIPRDLILSELFGHEMGAFTGATQRRIGRFELAHGGTIFLDEVGELLPDTQVALLRVLQEREFERVGGSHLIHVDVRVVAATNRDLKAAVANGTFRPDLFYRLNVFPVEVPPLRERKEDILTLADYFVQRYGKRAGKNIRSIDKKTIGILASYDWPGNIRELQNVIERSVILSSGEIFSVDEAWLTKETVAPQSRVDGKRQDEPRTERAIIEAALAEAKGRISGPSGAAAKLGIPPSTLAHRIKTLKIDKTKFKFR